MIYYTVFGRTPFGGGSLSITEDGKRLWGRKEQHFTQEEVDALLKKDLRPVSITVWKHTVEIGSGRPESVDKYAEKLIKEVFC